MATRTEFMKALRAAPGISIPHLLPGTKLLIETTQSVFELRIIDYEHVEVSGSDHRFHTPVIGRFTQSVYDKDATMKFPGWIGPNLRMDIEFKNATFRSTPAVSACVIGERYKYDVFRIISPPTEQSIRSGNDEGATPGAED